MRRRALLLRPLPARARAGADTMTWAATRAAGLTRLERFLPNAGSRYARLRNHDFGPDQRHNVSGLSPYLRHRLILEAEVLDAVLGRFAPSTAEKFVQELYWRSYWKGWLEHHPSAWTRYRDTVTDGLARLGDDAPLRRCYQDAVSGRTGIEPFDAWARELTDTGYLHNHARMWTASIWLFTLELPWALGADWFLRHLLDGDPASNTLSWRWVAGLHTRGKTYLARPDNILRYAGRRFDGSAATPAGLDRLAARGTPLTEPEPPARIDPVWPDRLTPPAERFGLLLGEDDLHLDTELIPAAVAALPQAPRSPEPTGSAAAAFTTAAIGDALARAGACWRVPCESLTAPAAAGAWAGRHGLKEVVMAYAPVGPGGDAQRTALASLTDAGVACRIFLRDHDRRAWPHAARGYFALAKRIPALVAPPQAD
ncbi:MAG: FAD-binding domain-containing protein [Pseudomonadales bacterium]